MTLPLLPALVLVAGMGFAAHRASLCTVRAVMEVMTSGTAYLLLSFAKAVVWTVLVSGTLIMVFAMPLPPVPGRLPFWAALLGGFVFGIGAAVNGGCSFSTLQRLADGDLGMGISLAGMLLGFVGMNQWLAGLPGTSLQPIVPLWHWQDAWAGGLLSVLWLWALGEVLHLWRAHSDAAGLFDRLMAGKYRLSSAAAVLGIGGGTLYAVQGAWTYSNFLRGEAASWLAVGPPPGASQALLLAALIAGIAITLAIMRRRMGGLAPVVCSRDRCH